jgi:hypothetical protein
VRVAPRGRSDPGWALAFAGVTLLSVVSLLVHVALLPALLAPSHVLGGPVSAPTRPPLAPTSAPTSTPVPQAGATKPRTPASPTQYPTTTPTRAVPQVPALDASCLRKDHPATGATIPHGDPYGTSMSDLGDKAELQRLYAVVNGSLTAIDGLGEARRCDTQLWSLVTATAPDLVPYVREFLIFDTDPSAGPGDWVVDGESAPERITPSTFDADHWRLAFGPNGLDHGELAWLVAHELAHIASLNESQLVPGGLEYSCTTEYTGFGCLTPTSYLYRYLDASWPDDLWQQWARADAISGADARRQAVDKIYESHRDLFVTRYAATHPDEDFAETLAMWCTYAPDEKRRKVLPRDAPADSGNKVAWMDDPSNGLSAPLLPGCQMLQRFAVQ